MVRLITSQSKALPDHDNTSFRRDRLRRMVRMTEELVLPKQELSVVDLGGTLSYWESMADIWGGRDWHITIVNRFEQTSTDRRITCVTGDVRDLSVFADDSFDIVHSNSVIEHVGTWKDMCQMAREVRRLAPAYYVQTPNFFFPFEPHYRSLCFHWLPEISRARRLTRRRYGALPIQQNIDEAMRALDDSRLLDHRQLQALFPDATLKPERFLFLTKSWIAVRSGREVRLGT